MNRTIGKTACQAAGCALTLLLLLPVGGCSGKTGGKPDQPASAPPTVVKVAGVVTKTVPWEIRTFGSVDPSASVSIRPQVSGMLTNVVIRDGQEVKAGDLLFSLDTRPAEAALAQAEANLTRSTVQLKNAEIEFERQDKLWKSGLSAQDLRDQARTDADALAAEVRGERAAADFARIQLGYCSIRSPFDGRTGKVLVDAGNVVKADDTALLTINRLHPVYISFGVPQAELGRIHERMAAGPLAVQALVPEKPEQPETGILTFSDNAVDKATGMITLHGTFSNEDSRLWPGQFVTVVLTLGLQENATVVPATAVQTGQKGTYVFVVRPDLTAETRLVTVERKRDEESVISAGLAAGERVVIDGQHRLRPSGKVKIGSTKDAETPGQP